jgi:hypothetical protein
MDAVYSVYLILLAITLFIHFIIIINLITKWKILHSSSFSSLIFHLHSVIFIECLTVIPFLYNHNVHLCEAIQFFNYYFTLQITMIVYYLFEKYNRRIDSSNIALSPNYWKVMHLLIVTIPLTSLFLFLPTGISTTSNVNSNWCLLSSNKSVILVSFSIYLPAAICSVCCMYYFIKFMKKVFTSTNINFKLFQLIMLNAGYYHLLVLFAWIPQFLFMFLYETSHYSLFWVTYSLVITRLGFGILFFVNEKGFRSLEGAFSMNSNEVELNSKDVSEIFEGLSDSTRPSSFFQDTKKSYISKNPIFGPDRESQLSEGESPIE